MPAAYLRAISASAPAQFCSSVPYKSRRVAAAAIRRSHLRSGGEVFLCKACQKWHIRSHMSQSVQAVLAK